MKKTLLLIIVLGFSASVLAQKNINKYKYVLIPKQYSFLKEQDQYQLNSLTKFLFNKYGYIAYFEDEALPNDLKEDRCLALSAEVKDDSNMFKTKLVILVKDCFDEVILKSQEGESKLKDFGRAYNDALREAFETFKELDYTYIPKEEKVENNRKKTLEPESNLQLKTTPKIEQISEEKNLEKYIAEPTDGGYRLINSENGMEIVIIETPKKDVFMISGKDAIIYKDNEKWKYFEKSPYQKLEKVILIKFKEN